MTNLTVLPSWDPVPQIDPTTPLKGGPAGPLNWQAQALGNRVEALRLSAGISAIAAGAERGSARDQREILQATWDTCAALGVPFVVDGVFWVSLKDRVYPDGLVQKVGLQVPSGSRCIFMPGSAIKIIPNDFPTGYGINFYLAEDFEVWNPVVYGERAKHGPTAGEWAHCMNIVNCKRGYVHRPRAVDAWGDGIYLGIEYYSKTNKQIEDVTVFEPFTYNCRRNGMSWTSGRNVRVVRGYFAETNGVWPQAGIDIEPEGAGATLPILENCLLESPTTINNLGAGIVVYTNALPAGSVANVRILHHTDIGSTTGFVAQHHEKDVKGNIVVESPRWEKSGANGVTIKTTTSGPRLWVTNPVIDNCAEKQENIGWQYDSAIFIGRAAGEPVGGTIGNFSLTGVRIRDTRAVKKTSFSVFTNDYAAGAGVDNLAAGSIKDAVIEIIEDGALYQGRAPMYLRPDAGVSIKFAVGFQSTGDASLMDPVFFNEGIMAANAQANVTFRLSTTRQKFRAFHLCKQYSLVVAPQADSFIYPVATAAGKAIYSNDPGASIVLHPSGEKDWIAEIISGNWVST